MSEPTNQDRARWAEYALVVPTDETLGSDHPDMMQRDDLRCAISCLNSDPR